MSKLYFIIKILFVKFKSVIFTIYFRFWGLEIGKGAAIWSKPTISGYLKNISFGNNCCIDERVRISVNKEGRITIGNNTLISANVNINSGVGKITIGNNTMIAANSYIINNDHNVFDTLSVKNSGHITKDIYIGDNCWIGANCVILKGITIGEGAIIGAGSVVTNNIKPYSINFGVPCRFSKFRFDKNELINKLKEDGVHDNRINKIIDEMEKE